MEERIVSSESRLPFRAIPAAALRGRGPLQLARGLATMLAGIQAASRLISALRPAAILGTGGYVCVPLFLAARLHRVPTMIYLPDVVPGLAVKFLARLATLTAVNVEDALPYLGFRLEDGQGSGVRGQGSAVSGQPSAVRGQPSAVSGQRSAVSRQPSAVSRQQSAISNQPSAVSRQQSAVSGQPSAVNRRRRALVTGYPVRRELFGQDRAACRRAFGLEEALPVVLVYGGSRGARSVNQALAALLPDLLERCALIHVCGREGDHHWLQAAAERLPTRLKMRYKLYTYLEGGPQSMLAAFGAADLALCRSGASTLAELPAAGLPAVLVPYPYVHQAENADYLVRRGAAVKVADAAMLGTGLPSAGPLFREVSRLLADQPGRERMAEQSRALARPDAAQSLAEALLSLAARRRN